MRLTFKNTKARTAFFTLLVVGVVWFAVILKIGTSRKDSTVVGPLLWFCWIFPLMLILALMYRIKLYRIEFTRFNFQYHSCLIVLLFGLIAVCLCLITLIPITLFSERQCNHLQPGDPLAHCIYSGRNLSGKDLHGADMHEAKLDRANLSDANLAQTNLSSVDASTANLENATLTHANLSQATFRKANLKNADLSDANLSRTNLSGADLTGARLDQADLSSANLTNVIGLTDNMLASISAWKGLRLDSTDTIVSTLGVVCSGQSGAEVMAVYDAESSFLHPVILLDADGTSHRLTDDLPREWWPARVEQIELVACIENEHLASLETCEYTNNATIERRQWQATISIYEAQTRRLLETRTLFGSSPDKCPKSTSTHGNGIWEGNRISAGDVKDVLTPYINPDGAARPLPTGE